MSVINKKPFVASVIESLTSAQLSTLKTMMNGGLKTLTKFSLINEDYFITTEDKGVKHISLEVSGNVFTGFLLYNNYYCALISYQNEYQQKLQIIKIKLSNNTYEIVDEYLDIDELREVVDNIIVDEKIDALSSVGLRREVVAQLPTGDDIKLNVVYLVPKQEAEENNSYDEYMYINNAWELLGNTTTTGGVVIVELEDELTSGTLSDDDYAKVDSDNCLIIYEDDVYYKTEDYDNYILYVSYAPSNNVLYTKSVQITRSSKAYSCYTNDYNKVIANPILAGTESALEALEVAGVKHKIVSGMNNPMTTADDLIIGGTDGAPTRLAKGPQGQVLKVGVNGVEWGAESTELPATTSASEGDVLKLDSNKNPIWGQSSGGIDQDVTVEIETTNSDDYANRTNYADPISLNQFIANCEAGNVYTEGTIAKVNNLLNNKAFRLLLIGTNHEVLAYDDTTQAKTTWQFLDMPEHNVRLGLPFNLLDWTSGSGKQYLNEYLNGINSSSMDLYPSNMDGLISAQGLLEACHTIFEELPDTLKRHIKTVRRYYQRKRNYMSVGANGGSESNSGQKCQLACNVFHLAGTDLGTSGPSGEGSGSAYSYFNSSARRIRFYNGTATSWWNASPYTGGASSWCFIGYDGGSDYGNTNIAGGVAPAFCI